MTEERVPRRDFLRVTVSTALTFGAGLPAIAQTSASAPPSPAFSTAQLAEFVLKNAKVITVDANFSISQAIAIVGERIVAVGEDAAMAAHASPATRIIDLKGKSVIPGLIDGHAHMDREGLKSIYPSLGPVRSIQDIQARIADLARKPTSGEWIVPMPIGDPPYYFNVPDILAEKRWPTRQDLDVAAPPLDLGLLASHLTTGFLRQYRGPKASRHHPRHGFSRRRAHDRERRQWRADRCVHRARDAADRRVDLVSPCGGLHARRARPRHADVGSRLSCLRHDQRV